MKSFKEYNRERIDLEEGFWSGVGKIAKGIAKLPLLPFKLAGKALGALGQSSRSGYYYGHPHPDQNINITVNHKNCETKPDGTKTCEPTAKTIPSTPVTKDTKQLETDPKPTNLDPKTPKQLEEPNLYSSTTGTYSTPKRELGKKIIKFAKDKTKQIGNVVKDYVKDPYGARGDLATVGRGLANVIDKGVEVGGSLVRKGVEVGGSLVRKGTNLIKKGGNALKSLPAKKPTQLTQKPPFGLLTTRLEHVNYNKKTLNDIISFLNKGNK